MPVHGVGISLNRELTFKFMISSIASLCQARRLIDVVGAASRFEPCCK